MGGCTIAAQHLLSGRKMRTGYVGAYFIIGVVFGLLTAAYGAVFVKDSITDIIGPAIIAGAVGALALSASNMTARFLLKKLGIEVVLTMRPHHPDERKTIHGQSTTDSD
jgi:hypothetical protein